MTDEIWLRREGETSKAYLAFQCYRRLSLGRSIERAWHEYKREVNRTAKKPLKSNAPSGAFTKWSQDFEWFKRAKAWDAHILNIADEQEEAILNHTRGVLLQSLPLLVARSIDLALAGNDKLLRDLLTRARFDDKRRKPNMTDDDFVDVLNGILGELAQPKDINNDDDD